MLRKIITIDEEKCNGCGECVTACAEGALQIINGKAKLVKEQFCDGFGDCIGECPTGALKIEERESNAFDINAVKENLLKTKGEEAVRRMEEANLKHESKTAHSGCPGTRMRMMQSASNTSTSVSSSDITQAIKSDLTHWPVQIHLVQPGAPFFKNKELCVMSTCGPIASADVHWRFIRGRSVVVGCPKLDNTTNYATKLGEILKDESIPKVIIVRMEVPCCGGLTVIIKQAVQLSGRMNLKVEEVILGLDGSIKSIKEI